MTTKEFLYKYSVQHKLLMCLDLPRVEYGKKKSSIKDMNHARKRNTEIAETLEQRIAEAKIQEVKNKEAREKAITKK